MWKNFHLTLEGCQRIERENDHTEELKKLVRETAFYHKRWCQARKKEWIHPDMSKCIFCGFVGWKKRYFTDRIVTIERYVGPPLEKVLVNVCLRCSSSLDKKIEKHNEKVRSGKK